jgi:hypothetical protein
MKLMGHGNRGSHRQDDQPTAGGGRRTLRTWSIGLVALLVLAGAAVALVAGGRPGATGDPMPGGSQSPPSTQTKAGGQPAPTRTAAGGHAAGTLRIAVTNTTGWGVDSLFTDIGVSWTRLDVGDGSNTSIVEKALSHGMKPLVVYSGDSEWLKGVSPSTAATQVLALAHKILRLGLNEIEFGNEVYYGESAASYAAQYNAAHVAVAGLSITLLATATTDYYEHARGGSGSWFHDLIRALPGGAGEIDALTVHPYGSMTRVGSDGYGWPMLAPLHAEAVAAGISPTLPWYITEVGQEISGDGIEGQAPVSPAAQATDLTQYLNDIKTTYPWIVFFSWYSCRDDSSGAFGLLNGDNSPRPAFIALRDWMAAHASGVSG